jgi:AcrR family transcriptional regulator
MVRSIMTPPATRPARSQRPRRADGRARQERGVRTEEAILQATMRLLAARGIQGTSLDLLADEVGVAKSSILWHFGSKEELLLRVAERMLDEVARGPVQRILALPTFEERAEASWQFFSETLRQNPELRRVMLYLIFESVEGRPERRARLQQLYRGIREMYEAGLRSVVPDAAQRRRLAVISVAALDGIFLQWLLDPEAIDLEDLHGEIRALRESARRMVRGGGGGGRSKTRPGPRTKEAQTDE